MSKTTTYQIIRFHANGKNKVVSGGLSLAQAKARIRSRETASHTCRQKRNVARTAKRGWWFEGFVPDGETP